MKQFFIIEPHSFIDVITNSSSELFVVETDKSIQAIEEMLRFMCDKWNELASAGAFGDWYTKNRRASLSGQEKEIPQIHPYDTMFDPIYVYTQEMYERDHATVQNWMSNHPNDKYGIGWGYESKNNIGKIIISSAGDNSIPHEMFEWIESAFGRAERFHLG